MAKEKNNKKKPVKTIKKKTTKVEKKSIPRKKLVSKKTVPTKKNVSAKKNIIVKKTSTIKKSSGKLVEVISPTKKIKKIKGYSASDLEMFKKLILEKRNEIIEQLQVLKEQMDDQNTGQYVNENSPYSLHMAEQGTDAQEREKLYLWAQRENKFLGYLEEALQRIEKGTYGICIECIDEPQYLCPTCPLIPKERLIAVPHTQHCREIKEKMSERKNF